MTSTRRSTPLRPDRAGGLTKARLALLLLGGTITASCGGGGGSGGSVAPPVQPPQQLTYSGGLSLVMPGAPLNIAAPSVTGDVDSWSIAPPLPAGVTLSSVDGSITGVPTEASGRVRYTVTAENVGGSTTTDIVLSVPPPVRFALVTHQNEGTFGRFLVDGGRGDLKHQGYVVQDQAEVAPEGLVVTPNGRFGFTTNSGSSDLTGYRIDVDTGDLTPVETQVLPAGDYSIAMHPSGTVLFVAAKSSARLESFSIDEVTGQLTPLGAALTTAAEPSDVDVSPDGDYLILTHRSLAQLDSYALDSVSFAPSFDSSYDLAPGTPQTAGLAISPFGNHVYAVFSNLNLLGHFIAEEGTGALTLVGSGMPTGPDVAPNAVTAHPSGRNIYVLNAGSSSLTRFSILLETGELTRQESITLPNPASEFTIEPAGRHGYLVDDTSHSCTRIDLHPISGAATLSSSVRTRRVPGPVTLVTGDGSLKLASRSLYVTSGSGDDVAMHSVEADGSLTALTPNAPAGDMPGAIATDPRGRFSFVANFGSSSISRYVIEADGSLTEIVPATPCGPSPTGIVVDPSGRFVYLLASGDETLQVFQLSANGTLTLVETLSSGTAARAAVVDPSGQYLYVAIQGNRTAGNSGRIDIYAIDPQTGALTQRSPNGPAPGGPTSLSFSPDGGMVYSTLAHADHLAPYRLSSDVGTLSPLSPGTPTGDQPQDIVIHPSGKYAYVAVRDPIGFGRVDLFDVRESDGALVNADLDSFTARASFTFFANPYALAISPDGSTVYALHPGVSTIAVMSVDNGSVDPSLAGHLTLESSQLVGSGSLGMRLTTKLE
jgi:6-phosphogluconolactonase (cycloisomerase 2 family)